MESVVSECESQGILCPPEGSFKGQNKVVLDILF